MKKQSGFLLTILICICILCGCGCTRRDGGQEGTVYREGGTGVLCLPLTHFDTFNPVLTQSETVLDAMMLVYDSLYSRNINEIMEPVLATKTEISADGLVYTVHLRNDVRWHDGELFSAYDVSYTLSAIAQAENSRLKSYLYGIADYTAKSNFVMEFVLTEPNSCFIEQLDFPVIQRRTDCSAVSASYVPVGTSAYRYVPSKIGRTYILEKNMDCVTRVHGKTEQIILKALPEADNIMYALESREVEAVHVDGAELRTYSPKGNVTTFTYTNRNFTFLGVNASGALADRQVRRAISMLIDREAIEKNAMFGRMIPSELPFVPGSAYNLPKEADENTQTPETLLTEAGYNRATDGRWQRETEEGTERLYVSVLINSGNEVRKAVAQEIVRQLRAFGIGASVDETDYETYLLRIETLEYDLFLGETVLGDALDVSVFVGSGATFASPGDARMDTFFYTAQNAVTQSAKDMAFLALADAIADEVPVISIGFGQNAVIVNDRIDGAITPVYGNIFCDFAAWNAK